MSFLKTGLKVTTLAVPALVLGYGIYRYSKDTKLELPMMLPELLNIDVEPVEETVEEVVQEIQEEPAQETVKQVVQKVEQPVQETGPKDIEKQQEQLPVKKVTKKVWRQTAGKKFGDVFSSLYTQYKYTDGQLNTLCTKYNYQIFRNWCKEAKFEIKEEEVK